MHDPTFVILHNLQTELFNFKFRVATLIRNLILRFRDLFSDRVIGLLPSHTKNPASRRIYRLPKVHKNRDCGQNNFTRYAQSTPMWAPKPILAPSI